MPRERWEKTHRHNSLGRENLTERHLDILRAVKNGANDYKSIAAALGVSSDTVKVYFSDPGLGIYNRIGLPKGKRSIPELLEHALKTGIEF